MSVEFIGYIATREFSEIHAPRGPVLHPDYIEASAKAHELSGWWRSTPPAPKAS
jgi:alkanesulfonate monooxygenase